jgi:hypothetical protein
MIRAYKYADKNMGSVILTDKYGRDQALDRLHSFVERSERERLKKG